MKRIQFLLCTIIILSVVAKVSITPRENRSVVLISDEGSKVEKFFRYRVNPLQLQNDIKVSGCSTTHSHCCRV